VRRSLVVALLREGATVRLAQNSLCYLKKESQTTSIRILVVV